MSVSATGVATASAVSTETNNILTIFIYPGKEFAECAASEHIYTLTPRSCHTTVASIPHCTAMCRTAHLKQRSILVSPLTASRPEYFQPHSSVLCPAVCASALYCVTAVLNTWMSQLVRPTANGDLSPYYDLPHITGGMHSGKTCWWEEMLVRHRGTTKLYNQFRDTLKENYILFFQDVSYFCRFALTCMVSWLVL